jgi:amino acid transporter
MYKVLLGLHVVAGNIALLAAAGAVVASKGGRAHAWVGRAFTVGMTVIFLTAIPMTVMKPNLFLFLIALFNAYLTSTGWLRATNRKGVPTRSEWTLAIAMVLTAVVMGGRGIVMLAAGDSMGTVLVVFAGIGGVLGVRDLAGLRAHRFRGKERIASHLTRMLGGTIGAITAFIVTNVRFEPAFVLWLLPSVVLTPLIVYWNVRVRRPARRERQEAAHAITPVSS